MNNNTLIIGIGIVAVLWTTTEAFKRNGLMRYIYLFAGWLVLASAISTVIQDNVKIDTPNKIIQTVQETQIIETPTPTQETQRTFKSVPEKKEIKMKKTINQLVEEKTNKFNFVNYLCRCLINRQGLPTEENEENDFKIEH